MASFASSPGPDFIDCNGKCLNGRRCKNKICTGHASSCYEAYEDDNLRAVSRACTSFPKTAARAKYGPRDGHKRTLVCVCDASIGASDRSHYGGLVTRIVCAQGPETLAVPAPKKASKGALASNRLPIPDAAAIVLSHGSFTERGDDHLLAISSAGGSDSRVTAAEYPAC